MLTARVSCQLPKTIAILSLLVSVSLSSAEVFGQSEKPAEPEIATGPKDFTGGVASFAAAEPLQIKPILSSEYANVPVNWPKGQVYRFGLLRSAQEFDQFFQPIAGAGDRRPHAPDAKIYENEMIVTISRVIKAPANLDTALQIKSVHLQTGDRAGLYVYFTLNNGPKSASHTVKVTTSVRIPKRNVSKVFFVDSSEGYSSKGYCEILDLNARATAEQPQ